MNSLLNLQEAIDVTQSVYVYGHIIQCTYRTGCTGLAVSSIESYQWYSWTGSVEATVEFMATVMTETGVQLLIMIEIKYVFSSAIPCSL